MSHYWNLMVGQPLKYWTGLELQDCTRRGKLDGVGPVDNRPSTDEHHHFITQKVYIYIDM